MPAKRLDGDRSAVKLRCVNRVIGVPAARLLLAAALIAITTLALIPQSEVPVTTLWDKADHALAFLVLGLLAQRAFTAFRFSTAIAPALLGYGALLEILQMLTPTRVGSLADLVADLMGLLLAAACCSLYRFAVATLPEHSPSND